MAHASLSQHTPAVQSETATQGTTTLPPLTYKNIPVLTSELLAQAYEVKLAQIQQNYANNKERFIERRSSQLSLPVGDVRQTISSLSVLIERAQSILAAFPANMGGVNHD